MNYIPIPNTITCKGPCKRVLPKEDFWDQRVKKTDERITDVRSYTLACWRCKPLRTPAAYAESDSDTSESDDSESDDSESDDSESDDSESDDSESDDSDSFVVSDSASESSESSASEDSESSVAQPRPNLCPAPRKQLRTILESDDEEDSQPKRRRLIRRSDIV